MTQLTDQELLDTVALGIFHEPYYTHRMFSRELSTARECRCAIGAAYDCHSSEEGEKIYKLLTDFAHEVMVSNDAFNDEANPSTILFLYELRRKAGVYELDPWCVDLAIELYQEALYGAVVNL